MVLPICKACLDEGHNNIIVRAARQNAKVKQAKNARELARAEVATAHTLAEMAAENVGSLLEADRCAKRATTYIYCKHTRERAQN